MNLKSIKKTILVHPIKTTLIILLLMWFTMEATRQINISSVKNTLTIVKNMHDNGELSERDISPWGTYWIINETQIYSLETPDNICANAVEIGARCSNGKFSFKTQ